MSPVNLIGANAGYLTRTSRPRSYAVRCRRGRQRLAGISILGMLSHAVCPLGHTQCRHKTSIYLGLMEDSHASCAREKRSTPPSLKAIRSSFLTHRERWRVSVASKTNRRATLIRRTGERLGLSQNSPPARAPFPFPVGGTTVRNRSPPAVSPLRTEFSRAKRGCLITSWQQIARRIPEPSQRT